MSTREKLKNDIKKHIYESYQGRGGNTILSYGHTGMFLNKKASLPTSMSRTGIGHSKENKSSLPVQAATKLQ